MYFNQKEKNICSLAYLKFHANQLREPFEINVLWTIVKLKGNTFSMQALLILKGVEQGHFLSPL